MRLLGILFTTLALAGCASQPETPEESDTQTVDTFTLTGDCDALISYDGSTLTQPVHGELMGEIEHDAIIDPNGCTLERN